MDQVELAAGHCDKSLRKSIPERRSRGKGVVKNTRFGFTALGLAHMLLQDQIAGGDAFVGLRVGCAYRRLLLLTQFMSVLVGERAQPIKESSGLWKRRHDPGRRKGEQPYTHAHTLLKRCHRCFSGGSYIIACP